MVDVIDPRITAGIGQQGQVNPLGMLGQFAQTQNALNQNALFQQTYKARAAMGPLAQQSVGQDGQMDWNKFATLVSTHPDTAWTAPDVLNNIAQKKLIDAETTNQELNATKGRMDIWGGILSAAAKDSSVNGVKDMGPYISQGMALGAFKNAKDPIAFLADPKYAAMSGPEFRSQILLPHAIAMQHGANALTALGNQWDANMGTDPATGQKIPGWRNDIRQQATPLVSGQAGAMSAGPTAGAAAAGGAPAAPGTAGGPSNFQFGQLGPAQEQMLKDVEGMRTNYNSLAGHASALQQVSDQLEQALGKVKAGAGAKAYQEAARFMQSLGVSDKNVDTVANGSLPAGMTADNLATTLGTTAVRQLLLSQTQGEGSAGRLTNMEFSKIVDIFPNIDTDPRAAKSIFNFIRRQNTLNTAKAAAYNDTYNRFHAHQGLDGNMQNPTQFEPYWTGQLVKRGLITQGVADDILAPGAPGAGAR